MTVQDCEDAGISLSSAKQAQYPARSFELGDLVLAGWTTTELKEHDFSTAELKAAGYQARDAKQGKYGGRDVLSGGWALTDLKPAEYVPSSKVG